MLKRFLGIAISFFFIISAKGQNSNVKQIADSMVKNGNYESALKLYDRFIYFYPDSVSSLLYETIGDCKVNAVDYNNACFSYSLAEYNTSDTVRIVNIKLKKTLCYILMKEPHQALAELFGIDCSISPHQMFLKNLYLGTCYYALNDVTNTGIFLSKCTYTAKDSLALKVIIDEWGRSEKRKPNKAKWMSVLLPGLGQAYAGDFKSGINSFVLTASLSLLFVYISGTYGIVDGLLSVLPWFQRYYRGGYTKAPRILISRQQIKKDQYYKGILHLLNKPKGA